MKTNHYYLRRRLLIAFILVLFGAIILLRHTKANNQEGARLAPRNVILFLGDGMGPEQVRAARLVKGDLLSFEKFPYQGHVTTFSANNSITDSAAAASAIATGYKVNNGVISVALPGDGSDLQTILEYFKIRGKSTGLVSTAALTDATPGGFGAHASSRSLAAEIAADYLMRSRPAVLFGGKGALSASAAQAQGYTVITDRPQLMALPTESTDYVSGQFGALNLPYEFDGLGSLPHLSEMVAVALRILDNNPQGFFLMVEGGRIDHAGHGNDLSRLVPEVLELDRAVMEALSWLPAGSETLILVSADHETGGLKVLSPELVNGLPPASWSTTGHTATDVPVYGLGYGAEEFGFAIDNTDFFRLISFAGYRYNSPPVVDAGTDITIAGAPAIAFLSGAVSDDEISSAAGVNLKWAQESGPAGAAIKSPGSARTEVTFEVPGLYILNLTAGDGFASNSDSLQVSVLPGRSLTPTLTPAATNTLWRGLF